MHLIFCNMTVLWDASRFPSAWDHLVIGSTTFQPLHSQVNPGRVGMPNSMSGASGSFQRGSPDLLEG